MNTPPNRQPQNKIPKAIPNIPHGPETGIVVAEHYEGLIPHPRLMKEWEELVPGSAESIFKRFEEQSKHRIESESRVIRAHNFKLYTGPIFAFIIAMTAIICGAWIAIVKEPVVGGIISFSGLAAVVAPFLISEYKQKTKKENN